MKIHWDRNDLDAAAIAYQSGGTQSYFLGQIEQRTIFCLSV
jgi:hypothetical protein